MTDRHAAYIVTLDQAVSGDRTERIMAAIEMISGVASVEPVLDSFEIHIAAGSRDLAWRQALGRLMMQGPELPS